MSIKEIATARMSKELVFTSYLLFVSLLFVVLFSVQLKYDFTFSDVFVLLPLLFSVHIVETTVAATLGLFLLRHHIIIRIIYYLLLSLYIVVVFVQYYSFYYGKEYVSQVAIENMDHIDLFFTPGRIAIVACVGLILVVLPVCIEYFFVLKKKKSSSFVVISVLCCLSIVTGCSQYIYPDSVLQKRDECFKSNSLEYIGPVTALYEALFVRGSVLGEDYEYMQLSMKQAVDVERFGFTMNARAEFPFIKEQVYTSPPPFELKEEITTKPNVIIFFTEGFSARSMRSYGSKYEDLTPNIDNFVKSSMLVNNYYNHTAATYRGLHGQLCSIYPEFGGVAWMKYFDSLSERDYYCLTDVFEQEGYETVFLDSHHKEHISRVDELISNLGFDTVLTGDVLSDKYLGGQGPFIKNAYSDKQFMKSLVAYLKERETEASGKPVMVSLYNFGTHAMLPMTEDGKKYRDGTNEPLNTIHSYDAAFGIFWEYFQASSYAENTIVVLTADHCHYPEKPFVDAFEEPGYQPYFVDRIPLVIYDPTRKLPETYEADYSTSIDFSPSLTHYLGMENSRNSFLGSSIFEKGENEYSGLGTAYFGSKQYYFIDNGTVHRLHFPEQHEEKLRSFRRFMSIVKRLELKNKIWDGGDK
ncbi:LTA synthase family protein [Desulfopila sp. IMCC35008]|uniref:LTA synthase family protein n=1 Tax=Desulfopila sp. IMCC35008 TaxID=2653858 RepID=UPI0013D1707C|nr:LTA synthase family protein [Desulfopila sp. IMCC35008]